eukprot:Rmarinus@m.5317
MGKRSSNKSKGAREPAVVESTGAISRERKEFDVIVFGATGFTGQLVCAYLAQHPTHPNWAMAGRSISKLASLSKRLNVDVTEIVASVDDPESLLSMCKRTRVLVTTVGPYTLYGEPVVKACLEAGCHYVDLTGEINYIRQTSELYHDEARAKGISLVSCSGFDCVPADAGVRYCIKTQPEPTYSFGNVQTVQLYTTIRNGHASGGTYQSVLNILKHFSVRHDLPLLAWGFYGPAGGMEDLSLSTTFLSWLYQFSMGLLGIYGNTPFIPHYSFLAKGWVVPVPFVCDGVIVRRTAEVLHEDYTKKFQLYYYFMVPWFVGIPVFFLFPWIVVGIVVFSVLLKFDPIFNLASKVIPSGTGPSEAQRDNCTFNMKFIGRSYNGTPVHVAEISGGEPGYTETSKILSEVALSIAERDARRSAKPEEVGVVSPVLATGDDLLDRLQTYADLKFTHYPYN